ncbi:uncharacterized protein [Rutidosis leptorrhynchoides]|uniref:uncharacterized protein isoform X1 n=1 Tax=Rutidosis leptorrhynchoides TaxID=125765 RepID=UPI003A992E58
MHTWQTLSFQIFRFGGANCDGHYPDDLNADIKVQEDVIISRTGAHIHVSATLNFTQPIEAANIIDSIGVSVPHDSNLSLEGNNEVYDLVQSSPRPLYKDILVGGVLNSLPSFDSLYNLEDEIDNCGPSAVVGVGILDSGFEKGVDYVDGEPGVNASVVQEVLVKVLTM